MSPEVLILVVILLAAVVIGAVFATKKKEQTTDLDQAVEELEKQLASARWQFENFGKTKLAKAGDHAASLSREETYEYAALGTTGRINRSHTAAKGFSNATRAWIRDGSPRPHATLGDVALELLAPEEGDFSREAHGYFEPQVPSDTQRAHEVSAAVANYKEMSTKLEDVVDSMVELDAVLESASPEAVEEVLRTPVLDLNTASYTQESLDVTIKYNKD